MRILLAEDEHQLGEWLAKALTQSGFRVDWVDDGRMAEASLRDNDYDALVLDMGLPGRSGQQVLKHLREQDMRLPVLILTARDSVAERVTALNEGADDFLAKPFALAELEARLMALMRRARGSDNPSFACGPLHYDTVTRQISLQRETLALSPREHALLRSLLQRSGEPLSKQQILDRVFSDEDEVLPTAVDVLVHRVRKRLEHSGVHIETYRGLGYVLVADQAPHA